jgi:aspartyl-tRNA(Asn)/glutamyl-tRNA(Gln) amidotransferase subunit A
MTHPLDLPLAEAAARLRAREVSAVELAEEALARVARLDPALRAYKHVDPERMLAGARAADALLARGDAPAMCGVPVSVKDLYGVDGHPTFAGTARELPARWSRDGWLVARLRAQGAVVTGKTHTVELATARSGSTRTGARRATRGTPRCTAFPAAPRAVPA